MPRKPLRSQLNQIRAWVRQGRTDAWIAHQLEVSTAELREFRRRHKLTTEASGDDFELRDEIEAEIEAAMSREEEEELEEDLAAEGEPGEEDEVAELEEIAATEEASEEQDLEAEEELAEAEELAAEDATSDEEERPTRRRRRRRGGRGRSKRGGPRALEATFDHGKTDGFGLWLDPAVQDDPVYAEHWAGHRKIEVSIEADRIVIKRAGS